MRSRKSYNIDVREFLTSSRNAVMQRVLHHEIPRYIRQHHGSVALFNNSHLWAVKGTAEKDGLQLFLRRKWTRLNPKFAGEVHMSIVEEAIGGIPGVPPWVLKELKRNFTRLFLIGPVIDSIDLDIPDYSPLDHFDNGYIPESRALVVQNLATFKKDNRANLQAFARSAHAIADFYAHSSYVHFARLVDSEAPQGHAELFDPSAQVFDIPPSYQPPSTFDLTNDKFSVNAHLWTQGKPAAAQHWANPLISGRYAQPDGTQPGLTNHVTEGFTSIPASMRKTPGFADRGSLPHHNQVAVDDAKPGNEHCLYSSEKKDEIDRMAYSNQFRWRKSTAILHVRKAFADNFMPPA